MEPADVKRFNLATLESIAIMKVNALFLRAKYRDYYDLYFLAKDRFSLRKIFELSQYFVEGITYKIFAIALVYIDDIEDEDIDHLDPIEKLSKEKIRDFFQKRLKQ